MESGGMYQFGFVSPGSLSEEGGSRLGVCTVAGGMWTSAETCGCDVDVPLF